ncbi:DUF7696 family protein [Burkholderia glumae]|uniref:DUF7696 family protein n=1 Tax=Burkholderia glumae TaxID=337 RepID=UPI0020CC21C0|nr:hypothetical protein [Burkholderia glumae]MCQ0032563.1 hypothetical protein [Burkholderia glumae]MCQ0035799.1 hypothetical protein [Burkholderia glumae]
MNDEQRRHECEVRHVLAMPSRAVRKAYLLQVESKRGADASRRLREDVERAWKTREARAC